MASNIKVTVKLDILKELEKSYFNQQVAEDIALLSILGINRSVAVGLSPVKDIGRFVGYKVQRGGRSKRNYPLSVQDKYPDKKVRPVNLKLSGKMLEAITYKINQAKRSVTIGIFSGKEKLIAETHNEGTQESRVPKRQFIPSSNGQEFVPSIMRGIIDVYRKRLNAIIEMSNKK